MLSLLGSTLAHGPYPLSCSRQVPHARVPFGRPERQDQRCQIDDQVPAQKGYLPGGRGRQRWHDAGAARGEHHVGYQLLGVAAEEGLAECGLVDHKGHHVTPEALVLDKAVCGLKLLCTYLGLGGNEQAHLTPHSQNIDQERHKSGQVLADRRNHI